MRFLITLVALVANFFPYLAFAGEYTPEGLYDVARYKLDNGLEIYLRERHETKSTSIRLAVNYGADDNECGKRETAHYLEHLLFTGTSKHSEEELDKLIEDNGGSWNAFTSAHTTSYEIDIYGRYTELALDVLHEIITDSEITEDNVQTTLDIINREAGGKYSWISRFLYSLDIGKTGYDKGNEVIFSDEEYCPLIENFEDIGRDDIIGALDRYYVPNNMALIIVGDFDSEKILDLIKNSFGKMQAKKTGHVRSSGKYSYDPQKLFIGTLNPLRGNDANVSIRYRIPGFRSKESLKFSLLSIYLSQDLYNVIRVDKGLSYSVDASTSFYDNYGTLEIYADSEIENMKTITDLMLTEINKLVSSPIAREKFDRVKRGALLNYVYAYQDNASIADFYKNAWLDLLTIDGFSRPDEIIEKTTPEDIHEIAAKYLSRDKAIISHDYPTLSYEQTYIFIILLMLLCVLYIRQHLKQHKSRHK